VLLPTGHWARVRPQGRLGLTLEDGATRGLYLQIRHLTKRFFTEWRAVRRFPANEGTSGRPRENGQRIFASMSMKLRVVAFAGANDQGRVLDAHLNAAKC